jgi:hypothetical protein
LYGNVPAVLKVFEYVAPCARSPLAHPEPETVCPAESEFFHVTVPPTATSTLLGLNANPEMSTLAVLGAAPEEPPVLPPLLPLVPPPDDAGDEQPAKTSAASATTSTSAIHFLT